MSSHPAEHVVEFETGSGNVFADLGLPDPNLAMVKADLTLAIVSLVEDRGWSEAETAAELGIEEATVTAIVAGDLAALAIETLLTALAAAGQDVVIGIVPGPGGYGQVSVHAPSR
jgi:predicted XRE-type DNA-binding protein